MTLLGFLPPPTIARYMAKMFLTRTLAMLAVLVIILQVLDLLSETDHILAYPGNGQAQILTYVSLRIPQIIQTFLPFCVLLATIITLATLNQNSEVISMKAAGLSAHQVLGPLLLASLAIAVAAFAFNERVVTRASATLDGWTTNGFGTLPTGHEVLSNIWVRDGDDLIHADTVTGRGPATQLSGISIYNRTGGKLIDVIKAPSARFSGGGLNLIGATRFDASSLAVVTLGNGAKAPGVTPERFTLSDIDPAGVPFDELWRGINDLKIAGRPTGSLESALWHKIAGPLSTVLMPLLGAVAGFGLARSGRLFVRAVIGMALGFAYFIADNLGLAMGDLGAYPPLLAAWGPFFLFALIGELVLLRTEE